MPSQTTMWQKYEVHWKLDIPPQLQPQNEAFSLLSRSDLFLSKKDHTQVQGNK